MADHDLPMIPSRRDVKGMTQRLAELRHGDQLAVTFQRAAYGVFTVEGSAVLSPSVKTFMVGSMFIESGRKPEKTVQAIEPRTAPPMSVTDGLDEDREVIQKTVDGLGHGDLVRATFEQHPHGRFTLTGVAVSTADHEVLAVGSWFLAYRGEAMPRVKELVVLAAAGTHHLPMPAPITAWESDDAFTG